jgi:hypothetical protein
VDARGYFLRILEEKIGSGECFLWPFAKTKKRLGYGKMFWDTRIRFVLVHRKAYEQAYGKIPDDLRVLHKCDQSLCFNPQHLYLGTQRENMQDAVSRGRLATTGERNSHAKLTDAVVLEIRQKFLDGATEKALEQQYGMHSLWGVLSGKAWKHVAGTTAYNPKNRRLPSKTCIGCGVLFTQTRDHRKYCSRLCRNQRWGRRRKPVRIDIKTAAGGSDVVPDGNQSIAQPDPPAVR